MERDDIYQCWDWNPELSPRHLFFEIINLASKWKIEFSPPSAIDMKTNTHQGSASCFFYLPLSEEEGGISVTLTQVKTEGPEINWVPILPAAHPTSKLWTSFSPFRAWSPSLFSEAVDTELLENLGTQCQLPGTCSIRITWDLLRTANPRSQLRPARTEPALNNIPG